MDFQNNPQSILTFRVGPVLCCAPSLPVISIITPPKLTHPPGSDRSQPGIFRHGTHIVKVIDLRQKFGIDLSEQTNPGHLIITVFDKNSFAFWVDQILDVFDFPAEGWGSIPPAIPRGIFSRTLLLKKQVHLYTEFINLTKLSDLGYLKHYIQQLKQSAQKESSVTTNNTTPVITERDHSTKNNPVSTAAVRETLTSKEMNPAGSDKVAPAKYAGTTSSLLQPTKTVTKISTPMKSAITENKPINAINTDRLQLSQQTTRATIKSPVIKPVQIAPQPPHFSEYITKPAVSPVPASAVKPAADHVNTFIEGKTNVVKQSSLPVLNDDDENESSLAGILFLIFIFLIGTSGITYMFRSPAISGNMQPEPTIIAETIAQKAFKTIPVENVQLNVAQEIKTQSEVTPTYRAEISKNENKNEITITIHKPKLNNADNKVQTEPLNSKKISTNTLTENTTKNDHVPELTDASENATHTIDKNQLIKTGVKTVSVEPVNQNETVKALPQEKNVEEVLHIVVKGDTLWAIAKKYVNDPFLYPELARLSHIKNPHRIYPGNRVRIRFVKD